MPYSFLPTPTFQPSRNGQVIDRIGGQVIDRFAPPMQNDMGMGGMGVGGQVIDRFGGGRNPGQVIDRFAPQQAKGQVIDRFGPDQMNMMPNWQAYLQYGRR